MELIVGFVSQNLVTQTNFVEFRESRILTFFRGDGCRMTPKDEIVYENLKSREMN